MFIQSPREHYFASAAWVSNTEVSVVWMNRPQNISVVTLCKSPMWYCQEVRVATATHIHSIMIIFSFFRHIKRVVTVVVGLMSFPYHIFQQMFRAILVKHQQIAFNNHKFEVFPFSLIFSIQHTAIQPVREGNSGDDMKIFGIFPFFTFNKNLILYQQVTSDI